MAMLGRWPAWCQLSCWRSIGTNGLMSGSKATGIRLSSGGKPWAWCRRIRNRRHWECVGASPRRVQKPSPHYCPPDAITW
jgi:hypothetical protein